jgi:hypothetical protein
LPQSGTLRIAGDSLKRRYALRDRDTLRWIMDHPGRGVPYSVRTLAEASGCSAGLVERLLTGRQKTASMGDAHSLTEALGVAVLVLFAPSASPRWDDSSMKYPPTSEE